MSIIKKILKMFEIDLGLDDYDFSIDIYSDLMKRPYIHYIKFNCKNLGFIDAFNFQIFLN